MNIALLEQDMKLWRTLYFLMRLLVLSAPLYLIMALSLDFSLLQNFFAWAVGSILSFGGWSTIVSGMGITVLEPKNLMFLIEADCTAWKSVVLFFALIFATPRKSGTRKAFLIRRRIPWFFAGVAALFALNILRILTSVWAEVTYGYYFSGFLHSVLWQFGLTAAVLVFWLFWLKKAYP